MIPAVAHFVWLGGRMPWTATLAIRSALLRGGFERAILHHEEALVRSDILSELDRIDGLAREIIDAERICDEASTADAPLYPVYRQLDAPVARSNVLRFALLHRRGGVYLDTDTLTVRDLDDLRGSCGAFVGRERIVYPARVANSRNPFTLAAASIRREVRNGLRCLPDGWRAFRRIERYYPEAENCAVFGCRAGHPMIRRLLDAIARVPAPRRNVRYALGTHLLQRTLAAHREDDVRVLEPDAFYPLPPEISEHWFRLRRRLPMLSEVVRPATRVVHWYASVRAQPWLARIDAEFLRRHRGDQLYSALACDLLDGAAADWLATP